MIGKGIHFFAAFQPLATIIREAIRDPMGVVIEGSIEVIKDETQATPAPGERAVQLLDARREEI